MYTLHLVFFWWSCCLAGWASMLVVLIYYWLKSQSKSAISSNYVQARRGGGDENSWFLHDFCFMNVLSCTPDHNDHACPSRGSSWANCFMTERINPYVQSHSGCTQSIVCNKEWRPIEGRVVLLKARHGATTGRRTDRIFWFRSLTYDNWTHDPLRSEYISLFGLITSHKSHHYIMRKSSSIIALLLSPLTFTLAIATTSTAAAFVVTRTARSFPPSSTSCRRRPAAANSVVTIMSATTPIAVSSVSNILFVECGTLFCIVLYCILYDMIIMLIYIYMYTMYHQYRIWKWLSWAECYQGVHPSMSECHWIQFHSIHWKIGPRWIWGPQT